MKALTSLVTLLLACPGLAQFTQTGRLEGQAGLSGDRFGSALAIDGDTLVVGALGADDADLQTQTCISGAAYIYQRSGNSWVEQQRLIASDFACRTTFGGAVAISGDTVAIGAHQYDGASISTNCNAGAVYIFTRTGTVWTEQQILVPSTSACAQEFGQDLALQGGTLVVGARWDDTVGQNAGAAYVFELVGGVWTEQQRLNSVSNVSSDRFGSSVAISGGLIAVGALSAGSKGEAYIFEKSAGTWVQQAMVDTGGIGSTYNFGSSLDLVGNTLAVAATGGNAIARVFVFEQDPTGWNYAQTFSGPSSSTDSSSYFGCDVVLTGDTLYVGNYGADHGMPSDSGCLSGVVNVYTRTGPSFTDWSSGEILAGTPICGENLGHTLAVDGDSLIAGAPYADGLQQTVGVIYSFERTPLGTATCFGVACPCGNDSAGAGCANSSGAGATLAATGSSSVSANDLRVRASDLPPGMSAIFAVGPLQAPAPLGGGLYCVGSPSQLYYSQLQNSQSGASVALDGPAGGAPGIISSGSTVVIQCIYRDRQAAGCGGRLNVSNALQLTFTP